VSDDYDLRVMRCGGRDCPGRHDLLEPGMTYEEIRRRESGSEPCLTVNPAPLAPRPPAVRPGMSLLQFRVALALHEIALERWRRQLRRPQHRRAPAAGDRWRDYDGFDAAGFEVEGGDWD
jgi:hypothetical protein